eukprot:Colp12_sorted_trinity150504_noHs@20653
MASRQDSEDFDDFEDEDDYMEDDDYGIDVDVDEAKKEEESDKFQYECLKPKDLISTQLKNIEEVNQIFQISASDARILLQHFGWDKERLVERYYDGDQEKLFAEAHIVNPHRETPGQTPRDKEVTCEICFVDYLWEDMHQMKCGHSFCKGCWNTYLNCKIRDDGISQNISCPAHGCPILVDELTVTSILSDPEVLNKYTYLIAREFVSGNKHVKWCPAPGCENAIRVPIIAAAPVKCDCGHTFCFMCANPVHDPVKCDMLKKWLKKCADDSETANWIAANTKECPKCKTTIEKNGGCNHMVCKSQSCKYEFCWVCMGAWEPHGSQWYSCNRFDEKDSQEARETQSKSRASLERYLHYYNRYANHEQSQRFETQLNKKVEKSMDAMQQHNMSWIEVQFLKKAVETLGQCRATLKYTYVFAYYLKKTNESIIFEDNQKDLEMATENLSGLLEKDIQDMNPTELKQAVLDKAHYCESRRKILMEDVIKGYDEDKWKFF